MFPASVLALSIALFIANSKEQLIHDGGSPEAATMYMESQELANYFLHKASHPGLILLPLEPRTPTGLGAFFSSSTLKSMGMSLEEGGLYS